MLKITFAAALLALTATTALASDVSYDKQASSAKASAHKAGPELLAATCACKR